MKVKKFVLILLVLPGILNYINAQAKLVVGRVTSDGIPVNNAEVIFSDKSDASFAYKVKTDAEGFYRLNLFMDSEYDQFPLPLSFEAAQNYPNPFCSETAIVYKVNSPREMNITIFDILGREVKSIRQGFREIGVHKYVWDGKDEAGRRVLPGVYFYRLKSGSETITKKMIAGLNGSGSSPAYGTSTNFGSNNKKEFYSVKIFDVIIRSDSLTAPLIVENKFEDVDVLSGQSLDFDMEEARLVVGYSIDGIKLGENDSTVLARLEKPDYYIEGDCDCYGIGFFKGKHMGLEVFFYRGYDYVKGFTVFSVTAKSWPGGNYQGKTKEGLGIGSSRYEIIKVNELYGSDYLVNTNGSGIYRKPPFGITDSFFWIEYDQSNEIANIYLVVNNIPLF